MLLISQYVTHFWISIIQDTLRRPPAKTPCEDLLRRPPAKTSCEDPYIRVYYSIRLKIFQGSQKQIPKKNVRTFPKNYCKKKSHTTTIQEISPIPKRNPLIISHRICKCKESTHG